MFMQKVLDEGQDVDGTVTQRRQIDGDDIQAIVEILTEIPDFDLAE